MDKLRQSMPRQLAKGAWTHARRIWWGLRGLKGRGMRTRITHTPGASARQKTVPKAMEPARPTNCKTLKIAKSHDKRPIFAG